MSVSIGSVQRNAALGAAFLFLSGCASLPSEFIRADRPGDSWEPDYASCRDNVESGAYQRPLLNPSGTVSGAAAAGVAKGISKSIEKYQLTAQCMRDRGYLATRVSAEERKILRGSASPERDRLVVEVQARNTAAK
ncbi:hypothetical protein [Aureimonas sp. AU12]|uniref:hypothetical protein n=1 Tax=Aureimonas sp. AU12 TaxID=1638161 RepID=UPI0012E34CF4|nr:hypothetical protein [Aureimonas sp. AU12]